MSSDGEQLSAFSRRKTAAEVIVASKRKRKEKEDQVLKDAEEQVCRQTAHSRFSWFCRKKWRKKNRNRLLLDLLTVRTTFFFFAANHDLLLVTDIYADDDIPDELRASANQLQQMQDAHESLDINVSTHRCAFFCFQFFLPCFRWMQS